MLLSIQDYIRLLRLLITRDVMRLDIGIHARIIIGYSAAILHYARDIMSWIHAFRNIVTDVAHESNKFVGNIVDADFHFNVHRWKKFDLPKIYEIVFSDL